MAWEERWHPLRREWVVITSHRDRRPWQGETVADPRTPRVEYDPTCYLCPGNPRVSGNQNPQYTGVFTFDNDHPCVGPAAPDPPTLPEGVYQNRRADGLSRVVCYSPRHDLSLAELPHNEVVALLGALQEQFRELASRPEVRHVLMFENKGEVVGVSNPHPHCQIYATNFVFRTIELEAEACAEYLAEHGRVLFQDVIAAELDYRHRLLVRRPSCAGVRTVFRSLSVRDVRRANRHARQHRGALAGRARASRVSVERRADSSRQPVAHADALRDGISPGTSERRVASAAFIFTSRSTRRSGDPVCSSISRVRRSAAAISSTTRRRKTRRTSCARRSSVHYRTEQSNGRSRAVCFRRSSRCTIAFAPRCSTRSPRSIAMRSPASPMTTKATPSTPSIV